MTEIKAIPHPKYAATPLVWRKGFGHQTVRTQNCLLLLMRNGAHAERMNHLEYLIK